MNTYAVICAAGAGSRMGRNKALCTIHGQTFLRNIVHSLDQTGIRNIVAVTGAQSETVRHTHRDLDITWAYNPDWQTTFMLETLICALHLIPERSTILHWPVDCVCIHPDDLRALLASTAPLAVLCWHDMPGHPMRIAPNLADKLRSGALKFNSLRDLTTAFPCAHIHAAHDALLNCNTPQMLAEFEAQHRFS